MFVRLPEFDRIQGYDDTGSALHGDEGRVVRTSSKRILLWLADIVCYLNPSTMIANVSVEVQVGAFVESVGQGSGGRSAEVVMDVGITGETLTAIARAGTHRRGALHSHNTLFFPVLCHHGSAKFAGELH